MKKTALFDKAKTHRFSLTRVWEDGKPFVAFIMLNPSTADDVNDDPTIRRCIRFAQEWGYGGMTVVNLFSMVSPYPKVLTISRDYLHENKAECIILDAVKNAGIIVAAWGSFKEAKARSRYILNMLDGYEIYCLGQNKDGSPKHPLYLPRYTKPVKLRTSPPKGADHES